MEYRKDKVVKLSTYRSWILAGGVPVVVTGALWWIVGREPGLHVTAELRNGRLAVAWSSCWLRQRTTTRFAALSRVDGVTRNGCAIVFCGVDCDPHSTALPIEQRWDYPAVPSGYKLDGICPEITEGKVYQAEVGGRQGGTIVFRVTGSESIEVLEQRCK